jgi:predicted transcriptional regulator
MAKRISIEVSDELAMVLNRIAESQHTTMTDVVRRALAVVKAAEKQKGRGIDHIGFARDASNLDVELVGLLD